MLDLVSAAPSRRVERWRDRRCAARRGRRDRSARRADAPARRGVSAAGDPRAAVSPADLSRRAHGEPADTAVSGRRGRCARACCCRGCLRRELRVARRARVAARRVGRALRAAGAVLGRQGKAAREPRVLLRAVPAAVRAAARRALDAASCCCAASRSPSRWRSLFAGIGFVEYARKELFLNPKVVSANQYDNYFRVNSLFFDPNIYGRFLALVMIARDDDRAVAAQQARRADRGAACSLWLLAGLVTSFSQSSIAALLLGLAVLAAYRWSARRTIYVSLGVVVLALLVVLLAPTSAHFGLKGSAARRATRRAGAAS